MKYHLNPVAECVGLTCIIVVGSFLTAKLAGCDQPAEAQRSRWRPTDPPRAGLECWETSVGHRVRHVECWPLSPREIPATSPAR